MNDTSSNKDLFIRLIRQWYRKNHRSYPWRNTNDPYKILISEFLLQKTNADLALITYKKFLANYPNVKSLSKANLAQLKKMVSPVGLSYRAERLLKTSRQLMSEFRGKIPSNRKNLLQLYGVGLYISNAVLCFAYNKRVAIIDTNTIRIFGRIFKIESNLKRPRTDRNLEKQFEVFLPNTKTREFNYALLDFGATICVAKKPKCDKCPLSNLCLYYQESTVLSN